MNANLSKGSVAATMRIPSENECYRLMAEMAMLDNIVAHSLQVCRVAAVLVDGLNACGHALDRRLVRAAALLHDITKTRSLKTSENHARTGARYLREKGYPEVGDIVGQHVILPDFKAGGDPCEAEVVNYADKRVMHDRVVSLEVRMADLIKRYDGAGSLVRRLDRMQRQAQAIEAKLFTGLPFPGIRIAENLDPDGFKKKAARFRQVNPGRRQP